MQVLKEELRQLILDTAIQEFLTQGYEAASLRKIAQQCNISPGSIYSYYPSKDDLYLNVTLSFNQERIEPILAAMNGSETPQGKLLKYCDAYYDYVKHNVDKFRLFMHYELHGLDEQAISQTTRAKLAATRNSNSLPFREIFDAAKEKGLLAEQLEYSPFIAGFTMAVRIALNEVLVLGYQDRDFYDTYIKMLLFGIFKETKQ